MIRSLRTVLPILDLFSNFKRVRSLYLSRKSQFFAKKMIENGVKIYVANDGVGLKWARPGKQEWRWGMNQTQRVKVPNLMCSIETIDGCRFI